MATPYIKSYINSIQNQRPYNEDDFVCYDLQSPDKEVCFVIDGCGAAGDVGAVVTQYAIKLTRDMDSISTKQIESLFIELNNYIFNYRKYSSVGCYIGTLLFVDNAQKIVRIASCGDVRTYFLHNDNLTKVTPDDSIIGALEDKGAISEAEAKQHPHRNMITQCCGKAPHIPGDGFAHMAELTFEVGDRLVVMTDGVYDPLYKSDIKSILTYSPDPRSCVNELFKFAVDRGSTDNATAAVYFF